MSETAVTASQMGLCTCHGCGSLTQLLAGVHEMRCRRCGAALHLRKPNSISRTWALLIASYILYIPANVLPIMHTGSLFGSQSDTIMSGVVYLWHSGSWHLALIVFIASILVPLAKIGDPQDIAAGILYLVSPAGRYVTGTELVIDGGYTAR